MNSDALLGIHKLHLTLMYEGNGNYTKFQSCIERCGLGDDEFIAYNALQALCMSGALNISWEESGIRWSYVSNVHDLNLPKTFVSGSELINNNDPYFPVIETFDGVPLCVTSGHDIPNAGWRLGYFQKFLPFSELVDMSVRCLGPRRQEVALDSVYSFETYSWNSVKELPGKSCLFRVSSEYSGFSYYVYDSGSNLIFKIKELELVFPITAYLLGRSLGSFFHLSERNVEISSSVRMPAFVTRFLFANCRSLSIGSVLRFKDVEAEIFQELIRYFEG